MEAMIKEEEEEEEEGEEEEEEEEGRRRRQCQYKRAKRDSVHICRNSMT